MESARNGKHSAYLCLCQLLLLLPLLLGHLHPLLLLEQLQCCLLHGCLLLELLLLHLLLLRLLLVLDRRGFDFGAVASALAALAPFLADPRSKLAPALLTKAHSFLKAIAPASVALMKLGGSLLK